MTLREELDPQTADVLDRYGFDAGRFETLRERVRRGELTPETNVVGGTVEPPRPEDIVRLPQHGEDGEARAAGEEALRRGELATIVLNGGMATRFGGVVKGTVDVLDGRSFLELKLASTREVAAALGTEIPVALMTSFATDEATHDFVRARGIPEPLSFTQSVSLRLEPDGSLFRGDDGRPSLYAPGHGDFLGAFRHSGMLARLRERGVRHVVVSNVDNLGARVDPAVFGMHLLEGRPVTAEQAGKEGDMGGAPARVDGVLQVLEAPRFPPDFDHDRIPVFNVNTLWIDLQVLDRDYELTWLYVEKKVDGRTAVQLEHLFHELTRFVPTTYLQVPRSGPRGRFFPVKTPDDLDAAREPLREMLETSPLA
ncbi:MAG TPA: UTP--glucose-1-phosphate uridylyltransferase [Gaiellaceae bacterium]|nr:UTP--glucose-1-phosphate uridylyltransferase [Gaiellaceae bacterium]